MNDRRATPNRKREPLQPPGRRRLRRGISFIETARQDLRNGARLLARNPGFTFIAVLSLAVGIGANTATFSFADAFLLRPLPVPEPSDVVNVGFVNVATGDTDVLQTSYRDYVDLRDASDSFAGGLTAFENSSVQFSAGADATPEILSAALVSGNFWSAMRVQPALGRAFRTEEDEVPGRDAVAVLSHRFWDRALAADPDVLGRQVRLNGIEFTVVGVAPERFTGIEGFGSPDLYVPLMTWPTLLGADQPSPLEQRDRRALDVRGRLRDGVTLEQARADVARIGAALAQEYPATNRGYETRVRTELQNRLQENPFLAASIAMLVLLGAVVLLVACVNVAGLLASRAPAREGEIALRLSIGAGRSRIVRQLFTESTLLALAGALTGAALGYLGILLWRQLPLGGGLDADRLFRMDGRVLTVNLVVALASVFVFGLTPALRASRASLTGVLRRAAGGLAARAGWGRATLVVTQVALSLVFIAVAAFVYASFLRQLANGPGVRIEGVLTMRFDTELSRYSSAQAQQFYERLADSAREVAGVEAASIASFVPMAATSTGQTPIAPEGHEFPAGIDSEMVLTNYVDADYFGLMEIPVIQGRGVGTTDTSEAPRVAVVNQELADRFWPDRSPVGQRFRANGAEGPWVEIVGVVPTGRYFGISEAPQRFLYLPYAQAPQSAMTLVVRSAGDPLTLVDPLRALVRDLDPNLAVAAINTMEALYDDTAVRNFRVFMYAIAAMAVMSVTLAFAGLYGLVASSVSQRTREIGIRMAVGADQRRVLRMVLGQGLRVTLIGLAVGLVLTLGADQALRAAFAGGNPDGERGLLEYIRVIAAMLAVTGLAAYLPARRAARIAPTRALRYE
jgi:putative ABC transport system permease protein